VRLIYREGEGGGRLERDVDSLLINMGSRGAPIVWFVIHKILWGGHPAHASVFGGLQTLAFAFKGIGRKIIVEKIIVGSIWDLWYSGISYVSLF
jgi:hypothetical protein